MSSVSIPSAVTPMPSALARPTADCTTATARWLPDSSQISERSILSAVIGSRTSRLSAE